MSRHLLAWRTGLFPRDAPVCSTHRVQCPCCSEEHTETDVSCAPEYAHAHPCATAAGALQNHRLDAQSAIILQTARKRWVAKVSASPELDGDAYQLGGAHLVNLVAVCQYLMLSVVTVLQAARKRCGGLSASVSYEVMWATDGWSSRTGQHTTCP
jgi:hypothetical protein